MGQVLHGCARTTEAVRRDIQNSQESIAALSRRYGLNPKTVAKWRSRKAEGVEDRPTGAAAQPSRSVLTPQDEAVICEFRRQTRLPLDDCYDCLKDQIPALTRSNLHRCLQRYGLSRLPKEADEAAPKRPSKNTRLVLYMWTLLKSMWASKSSICLWGSAVYPNMPMRKYLKQ